MKLKILVLTGLICSFFVAANAQNINEMPTITVTGTAEIQVVPDEAIFNLKVEKLNKDLKLAQQQNDETVVQIINLCKQFGVPAQNVKTDVFEYEERFTFIGKDESKRVFLGYQVSKDVVIRLSDMKKFEDLLREIIKSGVSKVESVQLQTTELRKYKDQARTMAMRATKEKATAMAGEIGQTIGKAVMILEGTFPSGYRYGNLNSNNNLSIGETYTPSYSTNENSTFSVGTISVKAEVTVSYLLN